MLDLGDLQHKDEETVLGMLLQVLMTTDQSVRLQPGLISALKLKVGGLQGAKHTLELDLTQHSLSRRSASNRVRLRLPKLQTGCAVLSGTFQV